MLTAPRSVTGNIGERENRMLLTISFWELLSASFWPAPPRPDPIARPLSHASDSSEHRWPPSRTRAG
jgi:hypothetical protein